MATRNWGIESIVNTTTAGIQFLPVVAGLTGGGYVIVWGDAGTANHTIVAQRYDALGNRVGAEMTIASSAGIDFETPSVTALADGGFYTTFTQRVGADNYILGAVYSATGALVRTQPVALAFGADNNSDVARLGTGSVVAWEDPDGTNSDVLFRIFDAAGNGTFLFNASLNTAGAQFDPSVAGTADGSKIALAWSTANSIMGRLFHSNGTELAPEFRIDLPAGGALGNYEPDVTWLNNEEFIVVWRQANVFNFGGNQIVARIFSGIDNGAGSTATALTGNILLNSTSLNSQQAPTITALPGGGFVASWEDTSQTGGDQSGFAIRLQAFDGAGGKIGGEILVNTSVTGDQVQPSVAALSDGRVVVTWTDNGTSFLNSDIRQQIIDPRDGIVDGSASADTLVGHDAVGDQMRGFGGSDTIYGLAGNDTINGGDGADVLYGGKGDDFLFGDAGNDRLLGGIGYDDLDGGADVDTVDYSQSLSAVTVNLSTGATSGGDAAGDTLTGFENINGSNVGNDTLTGNAAANVINGLGGADVMRGGLGNDTYLVDLASDLVQEAVNAGTDSIKSTVTFTMAANTERLYLLGIAAINGTGLNVNNDLIIGNGAANKLNGLTGNDTLTGALGLDVFLFNTVLNATTNHDTITDFSVVDDTIQLENAIFTLLTATGTLTGAAFRDLSLGAQDANDIIIYNRATGDLFYDSNGLTAGGQTLFADVTNNTALTFADFVVV